MKDFNTTFPNNTNHNGLFCTCCDTKFNEFSLSKKKIDIKELKKRACKCYETGKAEGELCGKVFIVDFFNYEFIFEAEE
ncbi:MAG: hypothetical protein FJ216_11585 [Ignavibacteria bacterium]|nr:hypothetical protein [Ignavibacteria bacterium]